MNHGQAFRAVALRDHGGTGALDPVLGVDHAWMGAPTFPPHAHSGMSAVSYVFPDAETGLKNEDSNGTRNLIRAGGLHWMAAGRGVVHEEVPAEAGKAAHLLQIFVALPRARQGAAPFALPLEPEDVPVVDLPGVRVRVPLGQFGAARSPLQPPTAVTLLDVHLLPGGSVDIPVPGGSNAFVLPVTGRFTADGIACDGEGVDVPAYPATPGGTTIRLEAAGEPARAAIFMGAPIARQQG